MTTATLPESATRAHRAILALYGPAAAADFLADEHQAARDSARRAALLAAESDPLDPADTGAELSGDDQFFGWAYGA